MRLRRRERYIIETMSVGVPTFECLQTCSTKSSRSGSLVLLEDCEAGTMRRTSFTIAEVYEAR